MSYFSDDPGRDFDRWDEDMERGQRRHFVDNCPQCGEPVYDYEEHYDFDGYKVHDDCMLAYVEQFKVK